MLLKQGDWVIINDHTVIKDGTAAEILRDEVEGELILVHPRKHPEIEVPRDTLRKKKTCVCGETASWPFCDGSHSGRR